MTRSSSGPALTSAAAEAAVLPPADGGRAAAMMGKHIRGSSLLLTGRVLALVIKLLAQLAMVRYLTTADYGSWAQVLAMVTLLVAFSSLSLDRGLTRFASIFHEKRDYDRFFGALILVAGAVIITAVLFVSALYVFPDQARAIVGGRETTLTLLFILIFIVPLDALDQICIDAFATLGHAGTIFFRKYLLGPLLQLSAVMLTVLLHADVRFMALTYLGATLAGLIVNGALLLRTFRREGLLSHFQLRRVSIPAKPMFSFALPLMTSDWLEVLIQSSGALILGYIAATEDVAMLRVVVPLALLAQIVVRSFDVLYVPTASRLFSRRDEAGIAAVYWRTAFWVAVAAFPIFAVTFTLSTPLTVLLYGARYESSGAVLAVLALGTYVKAPLSFAGATLKVLGEVRPLAGINLVSAAANVVLNIVLVPRYGVMGAATAMSGTMVLDALLKNEMLRRLTGLSLLAGPQRRHYAALLALMTLLVAVRASGPYQEWLLAVVAMLAIGIAMLLSRAALGIEDVFPEVRRVPLLRLLAR